AIMGAVLGAVSPAVVVPRMVQLMETKYGTKKGVPQLILAGASLDDVFVIVLFSAFIEMAQGNSVNIMEFVNIPVSIVLGVLAGTAAGLFLSVFFETKYAHKHYVRNSMKVIIVLGTAFLLIALEEGLKNVIPVSGLLAVMSMACMLQLKSNASVSARLSAKFGKLWIAAEVILFVLVGAAVDIRYTLEAGPGAVLLIMIALIFRSAGVYLCLIGTKLNSKEKLFCVISYLPKATVQAAIGSVPLSLGLPCGNIVLSVAVLSIIITAPLGALGIDMTYRRLLEKETP
ncbi:MAG: cation:proton antiporter, partial [Alistipes sp.]|nr:cation:proton antiporter [Alistipes sp.]